MSDALGKTTFELNKGEYSQKLTRIISNHRVNSKLVGEPRDFVLRSCRLVDQWAKLGGDPEVNVYLRNLDIAGGRKIKMISLERAGSKQPVPKQKLVDALYPAKKIATSATPEEKHFNNVRVSMRFGITYQLRAFRYSVELPVLCELTYKKIRPGEKTDVDHIGMSFAEIADSFVAEKGLKYTDIALKGPPTAKVFSDRKLWEEWIAFHMSKARYALVCASANRSKGCGSYVTPEDLIGSFKSDDPDTMSLDF